MYMYIHVDLPKQKVYVLLKKVHIHACIDPPSDKLAHVCVVQLRVDVRFDPVKEGGRGRVCADILSQIIEHLLGECLQQRTVKRSQRFLKAKKPKK